MTRRPSTSLVTAAGLLLLCVGTFFGRGAVAVGVAGRDAAERRHQHGQQHLRAEGEAGLTATTGTLEQLLAATNADLRARGMGSGLASEKQELKDAWAVSGHSPQRSPYVTYKPSTTISGEDKVGVYFSGGVCRIDAEESGFSTSQMSDWYMNLLKPTHEGIRSVRATKLARHKDCGCESKRLYGLLGCSTYHRCRVKKTYGHGMEGFVEVVNAVGPRLLRLVQRTCPASRVREYVFQGYSRGGGIATVLAFLFHAEALVDRSKMKLITFGSPRALDDASADYLHGKFPQYRLRNNLDPVPSLPPDFLGYKHVGKYMTLTKGKKHSVTHRSSSRDLPTVSGLDIASAVASPATATLMFMRDIQDHLGYSEWLGTPP